MKVLHVSPSYHPAFIYGGPIRSTHQMNLGLAEAGMEVDVLTTDANGDDRLKESGQTVAYCPNLKVRYERRTFRPDISLGLLWRLISAVRRADVVHLTAVYSFSTIPTLFWARSFGKPLFWSPRGALLDWERSPKRTRKSLWDAVCRRVAGDVTIVAASEREAEAARQHFPRMNTVVLDNAVPIPAEPSTQKSEGSQRVVFLGRLHPIKGLENLLDAFAALTRKGAGTSQLELAGPGEAAYVQTLRARAKQLEVADSVTFAGPIGEEKLGEWFDRADVLVLPSFSENFGRAVAEALAHGVPVVASEHTPWSRLNDEGCGRWVPNDPESLARAIAEVLSGDRAAMGARGRAWMQREFSPAEKTLRLCQYYREAEAAHG